MALMYFPYKQGQCFIIGLTSDIKPTNLSSGSIFLESDTYKVYSSTGIGWRALNHSGSISAVNASSFVVLFPNPLPLPYIIEVELLDPSLFTISKTAFTTLKSANGFTIKLSANLTGTIVWNVKKL